MAKGNPSDGYPWFLVIATGSLRELETYGELSQLLGYAAPVRLEGIRKLSTETGALLPNPLIA